MELHSAELRSTEHEESITNSKRNEKANNCTANEEDVVNVIQAFEEIIKNKKSDIVWLAYYQGQIFQMFKEKERFVSDMVLKFNVGKSTILIKIALSKLIDDYPKVKDSSLSLHHFKKN